MVVSFYSGLSWLYDCVFFVEVLIVVFSFFDGLGVEVIGGVDGGGGFGGAETHW